MKKSENKKTTMLKILPVALAGLFLTGNVSHASTVLCSVYTNQNATGGARNESRSCSAPSGESCTRNGSLRNIAGSNLNDNVRSALIKITNVNNDVRATGTIIMYKHGNGSGGTIKRFSHVVDDVDDNDTSLNTEVQNFDGSDVSSFDCRLQSFDE